MDLQAPRETTADTIGAVYRAESRRVFATLVRLLGDFDLAEEALHEAFTVALERWPAQGVPRNPRAWLVSTGRFRAIDALRRRARFEASLATLAEELGAAASPPPDVDDENIADERLRLIFTCCHPALGTRAQVALTLREVCGLTTEETARAFLSSAPAIARHIVRAKAKIRDAGIPYEVPSRRELPARLDSVLRVVYLVFTQGYATTPGGRGTPGDQGAHGNPGASSTQTTSGTPGTPGASGAVVAVGSLTAEAIRLGRLLVELLPESDAEAVGLLALMLLHDSRSRARASAEGDLVLIEDQDRTLWDREKIAEGLGLVDRALTSRAFGPYTLQAAIAALHAEAATAAQTDWPQIVALYDLLLRIEPSPVIELNRAVAVAMRDGPEAGLALIDALLERGGLEDYHLAHAARADLSRRLGRRTQAAASYSRALHLVTQAPERRFLERRLAEVDTP